MRVHYTTEASQVYYCNSTQAILFAKIFIAICLRINYKRENRLEIMQQEMFWNFEPALFSFTVFHNWLDGIMIKQNQPSSHIVARQALPSLSCS